MQCHWSLCIFNTKSNFATEKWICLFFSSAVVMNYGNHNPWQVTAQDLERKGLLCFPFLMIQTLISSKFKTRNI